MSSVITIQPSQLLSTANTFSQVQSMQTGLSLKQGNSFNRLSVTSDTFEKKQSNNVQSPELKTALVKEINTPLFGGQVQNHPNPIEEENEEHMESSHCRPAIKYEDEVQEFEIVSHRSNEESQNMLLNYYSHDNNQTASNIINKRRANNSETYYESSHEICDSVNEASMFKPKESLSEVKKPNNHSRDPHIQITPVSGFHQYEQQQQLLPSIYEETLNCLETSVFVINSSFEIIFQNTSADKFIQNIQEIKHDNPNIKSGGEDYTSPFTLFEIPIQFQQQQQELKTTDLKGLSSRIMELSIESETVIGQNVGDSNDTPQSPPQNRFLSPSMCSTRKNIVKASDQFDEKDCHQQKEIGQFSVAESILVVDSHETKYNQTLKVPSISMNQFLQRVEEDPQYSTAVVTLESILNSLYVSEFSESSKNSRVLSEFFTKEEGTIDGINKKSPYGSSAKRSAKSKKQMSLYELIRRLFLFGEFSENTQSIELLECKTKLSFLEHLCDFNIHIIPQPSQNSLKEGKRILIQFQDTQEQLQHVNQILQNLMFQTISHELGTYINFVYSASDNPENQGKDNYKMIQQNAQLMMLLLQDIRFYCRYLSQGLILFKQIIDVKEVAQGVIELFENQLQIKGISLKLNVEIVATKILNDQQKIIGILFNLIRNAIKFSPSNTEITLSITQKNEESPILVSLTDQGCGITSDEKVKLDRLLSKKVQHCKHVHHRKISKHSAGFGFGLTISNVYASKIGMVKDPEQARIQFKQNEGKGATFWFYLDPGLGPDTELQNVPSDISQNLGKSMTGIGTFKLERSLNIKRRNTFNYQPQQTMSCLTGMNQVHNTQLNESPSLLQQQNTETLILFDAKQRDFYKFGQNDRNLPIFQTSESQQVQNNIENNLQSFEQLNKKAEEHLLIEQIRQAQKLILIVDDEPNNIFFMKIKIQKILQGFTFVQAEDGTKAVEEFENHFKRNQYFSIIFMDLNMVKMSGFEATKEIRNIEANAGIPKTPICAFTSYGDSETELECFLSGMTNFLTKPILEEKLLQILQKNRLLTSQLSA